MMHCVYQDLTYNRRTAVGHCTGNIRWGRRAVRPTESTFTLQYPRDRQGQRRDTRRIVSMAGAAAWLPHSKRRNTCMISG